MPWSLLFRADVTPAQRRTLLAAALGWMLDAFDVMLYALVVAHIMRDLQMTKATVGLLNTLMLLASGAGGILFGFIADRIGRTRALALSILTYSICSFASGLSQTVLQLALFRRLARLGDGRRMEHRRNPGRRNLALAPARPRAMAMVQSSWAIGYALAALVAGSDAAPGQLALCVFCWRAARPGHLLDPPPRARVRTMAQSQLHSISLPGAGNVAAPSCARPSRRGSEPKPHLGISSVRRGSAMPSRSLC